MAPIPAYPSPPDQTTQATKPFTSPFKPPCTACRYKIHKDCGFIITVAFCDKHKDKLNRFEVIKDIKLCRCRQLAQPMIDTVNLDNGKRRADADALSGSSSMPVTKKQRVNRAVGESTPVNPSGAQATRIDIAAPTPNAPIIPPQPQLQPSPIIEARNRAELLKRRGAPASNTPTISSALQLQPSPIIEARNKASSLVQRFRAQAPSPEETNPGAQLPPISEITGPHTFPAPPGTVNPAHLALNGPNYKSSPHTAGFAPPAGLTYPSSDHQAGPSQAELDAARAQYQREMESSPGGLIILRRAEAKQLAHWLAVDRRNEQFVYSLVPGVWLQVLNH